MIKIGFKSGNGIVVRGDDMRDIKRVGKKGVEENWREVIRLSGRRFIFEASEVAWMEFLSDEEWEREKEEEMREIEKEQLKKGVELRVPKGDKR